MKLPSQIGPIHFVGIGGIGMSGIAEVLLNLGHKVQGSDLSDNANVKRLREHGTTVFVGHDKANLGAAAVAFGSSYFSARGPSLEWPYDYFHLNSIEQEADGSTLLSARNTWALYELNTRTGKVITTIGGRNSNVKLGPGAGTAYQHDASRLAGGAIAIFDNGAVPKVHSQSRGVVLSVSPASRTVTTVKQFLHPTPLLAGSQGNLQVLPNGDVFIGWGASPYFSEFSPSGQVLFDAHMHGSYQSYRTYRLPWTGAPSSAPAIAAGGGSGALIVRASWNGDTRTSSWRVLGGPSSQQLAPVAGAPRAGFETPIAVPGAEPYVAVQALDAAGNVLGTSPVIRG